MKKKILIPLIIVLLLLAGGATWLALQLNEQKQENAAMQELAELDKQEMENEYADEALKELEKYDNAYEELFIRGINYKSEEEDIKKKMKKSRL